MRISYILSTFTAGTLIRIDISIYTLLLAGALCFASCDDEEPILPEPEPTPTDTPEPEPEPDPTPTDTVKVKALAIQPDWSDALSEEHIPNTYNLFIGDTAIIADAHILYMYSDSTATEPYSLIAYNQPKGITITDSIATINETEDGLLTALPEYLFATDTTVEVAAGDTALVPLPMRRLLMPITLTLNFTEPTEVTAAEATLSTLSGLVSAIHLPDGTPVGDDSLRSADGGTASLHIEALPDNEGIVMYLRTFGIVPELHQMLNVTVTLADGEPEPTPEPEPDPEPEWPPYYPEWPPYRPDPEPEPQEPVDVSSQIKDWDTEGDVQHGEAY